MERTIERSPEEIREIERHKYFLSERVGHDVGWDFAEKDWEENHAAGFRASHRQHHASHGSEPLEGPAAQRGGLRLLFARIFGRGFEP